MSLLSLVEDRLNAQATPPLQQVEGAASFAALTEAQAKPVPARQPAAWVIPVAERGETGQARLVGATRQRIALRVGVVIAKSHAGDRSGDRASREMEPIARAVRDALFGWAPPTDPPGGFDTVVYTGGRLLAFRDGYAWWLAEFETSESIYRKRGES